MKLVGGDNGAYEREEWKDSVLITPSERAIVEAYFDVPGEYTIQNKTPDMVMRLGKIIVSKMLSFPPTQIYSRRFAIMQKLLKSSIRFAPFSPKRLTSA